MPTSPGLIGPQNNWYDDFTRSQPGGVPRAEGYSPASASASRWTVSPDQTVESRTANIIRQNSPLSQLAESRSLARSNERGLINSSIAIGAGQTAVYDAAVPIATSDATMFGQAARTNAELGTQTSIANAGFTNEASRFGAGARNDLTRLALTERGQDTRMGREFDFRSGEAANLAASVAARDQTAIQADRAAATALAGTNAASAAAAATVLSQREATQAAVNRAAAQFGANVQLELAEVNRQNQAILNRSYNAVNAQSAYAASLNAIALSTLDPAAKDAATRNAFTVYRNSLALISSVDNVADLSTLVDFSGRPPTQTPTPLPPPGPPSFGTGAGRSGRGVVDGRPS